MEDLCYVSLKFVRDVLNLAENIEEGAPDSEHVTDKAEEYIDVHGVIYEVDELQWQTEN